MNQSSIASYELTRVTTSIDIKLDKQMNIDKYKNKHVLTLTCRCFDRDYKVATLYLFLSKIIMENDRKVLH